MLTRTSPRPCLARAARAYAGVSVISIAPWCDKAKATSTTSSCAQEVITGRLFLSHLDSNTSVGTAPHVIVVLATNETLQQPRFQAQQRDPHQDSFVSTSAEESVPKDASLLETDIGSGENLICDGEAVGGIVDGCDVDDCGTVAGCMTEG